MNQAAWIDEQVRALEHGLSEAMLTKSAAHIMDELQTGTWIYGAGNYGRQIAAAMSALGLPCLGYIDQRGNKIVTNDGLPVFRPEEFSLRMAAGKICLICVFNPQAWAPDILPWASCQGFHRVFWGADLPEVFGPAADSFWLTSRQDVGLHFEGIRSAANWLSDQASVETFFSLLQFRLWAENSMHPSVDSVNQYLPQDLPGFQAPITFVDGGAFNGDTYRFLRAAGVGIKHWIAFEPDLGNFADLAKNARDAAVPCTLFPCGLSDHSHHVTFQGGMGTGSRIGPIVGMPAIETTINCVALDDVIQGIKVDYIKCDIEGSERVALNGMSRTLAHSRPRVALSLYHKPRDLWELVNQLAELLPASQFFIRQHAANGFETVLYALPH